MKKFLWGVLFFLSGFISANSDPVIWSGIGYFVDADKISSKYPNISSLEKDLDLAKLLSEEFSENEKIIIGGSGNKSSDEGLNSILLAITSEKVFSNYRGKSPLDGTPLCYRTYLLGSQVVLYSLNDKKILKAFPSSMKRVFIDDDEEKLCNYSSKKPKFHAARFADILWGTDISKDISSIKLNDLFLSSNISSEGMLREQINNIINLENIYSKGNQPIGVRSIVLTDYAKNQLAGNSDFPAHQDYILSKSSPGKEFREWLGSEFSKWLSQDLKISIVPFYEGEGLTLKIGTTFSNSAEALNLKKPELSFGFDYAVRGYRKVNGEEQDTFQDSLWFVYSGIKFGVVLGEEPEDFKVLATIPFNQTTAKQYLKSDIINDWEEFDETAKRGMRELSRNLIKQNSKWVKKSSEISSKEFRNFAKTILNKVDYEK